jgi:hypothetical protein
VALEFSKLVDQVEIMGSVIRTRNFDRTDVLALAKAIFDAAGEVERAHERIAWVRSGQVSGYRGAGPLPPYAHPEPVNAIFDPPAQVERAFVIAADGSQIYPDETVPVPYFLLNIGLFTYFHGIDYTPAPQTLPVLYYHQEDLFDARGDLIRNSVVDELRTLAEIEHLAGEVRAWARESVPRVALYDNRLLFIPRQEDSQAEGEGRVAAFIRAMGDIRNAGAVLAGYVDNPLRARRVVQLLYLLSLESPDARAESDVSLARGGTLDGLTDVEFFEQVLGPGQRSALMTQNSPQNLEFSRQGRDFEIAFFYLKVANLFRTRVVRVDIPMWVARDRPSVDLLHSLLLSQCALQGRNPYPYAITRADELAYIGYSDHRKVDELVSAQVRRHHSALTHQTIVAKQQGKDLARSGKRYHDLKRGEMIDRD